MAHGAKEILGQREIAVVADMGYYSHEELKKCEEAGIAAYVSKPINSKNTAQGLFGKQRFVYEPELDCYLCPKPTAINFPLSKQRSEEQEVSLLLDPGVSELSDQGPVYDQ